jgi:dTDP-4-dehydrorhamnose 3,5-epimerase
MTTTPPATTSARKDDPHVSREWEVRKNLIDGARTREVRNIVTRNGTTTELFRKDWDFVDAEVVHMIHVTFRPGALSAWHMHKLKTDHLFVVSGLLRVVMYDGRPESPTHGAVNEFHLSHTRPTLVAIPPAVWHGVQNLAGEPSTFVNFFDAQYDYDNPDEWRLPHDTPEIPYRFAT